MSAPEGEKPLLRRGAGWVLAVTTLAVALLGGCMLVVAFLVGAHWVDVYDSTCGGVYRPDLWFDDDRCRGRMLVRTGGVLLLVGAGTVLLVLAFRRSSDSA